ncbi:MAG: nitric-oxide reductase large subunit [Parvularculales bacterium]
MAETYQTTFTIKRLWAILGIGVFVMFGILLLLGREIYHVAPPIPETVQTQSGTVVFSRDNIQRGQNVWQSMGGMQQGSIWGHGSYVAPDWSADWLQREAKSLGQIIAAENPLPELGADISHGAHLAYLRKEMRTNTYDEQTRSITISENRAAAIARVIEHYSKLFRGQGQEYLDLRRDYAMPLNSVLTEEEAYDLSAFFFWASWSASTNRPDNDITYTSNWPHEPLVGNKPSTSLLIWSIISVVLLLAGIGAIVWYYAKQYDLWRENIKPDGGIAKSDFMDGATITPSMRATAKYFWLVTALFGAQVLLGVITAHYAVEGQGFYGLPFFEYLPYSVTRTWHTQLAVYWIATAWLASGLYIAPLLSGKDPKFQLFGVNFLFISLIVIVVGSFLGEWAAVHGFFENLTANFWFGHQGYEYIDLGRFWQIYLAIGLILWVGLVLRALMPVLTMKPEAGSVLSSNESKSLFFLVVLATLAIGLLYLAGLMWGQHTHISIMNYWRWWVVHLWVEGMFEVFATAIISVLFIRMGLLRVQTASVMVLFATIVFLFGGVLGTFHHLYFSGTPIAVIAVGASFSALEVVPLMVIGFEAYNEYKIKHQAEWEKNYHWPFMFFGAVLFWNLVGAGLFGFMINPPIALYYMQGLNLTANHGHAALFGVYGMLGLGLMLYCMRGLTDFNYWNEKLIKVSFWSLNIGMAMMTFLSLLPQGILQTIVSVEYSYADARSAEMIQSPVMQALVWARVPGDIVFSIGVGAFALFVFQAFWKSSKAQKSQTQAVRA